MKTLINFLAQRGSTGPGKRQGKGAIALATFFMLTVVGCGSSPQAPAATTNTPVAPLRLVTSNHHIVPGNPSYDIECTVEVDGVQVDTFQNNNETNEYETMSEPNTDINIVCSKVCVPFVCNDYTTTFTVYKNGVQVHTAPISGGIYSLWGNL